MLASATALQDKEHMPDTQARIAAIIPNFNGKEMLGRCLVSLRAQVPAPTEIVVVDNGSSDGSCDMVRADFPDVKLIALDTNTGFAAANNMAAGNTDCEFLLLVNNDCVAQPGWLAALLEAMGDDVGAVTSSMRNVKDTSLLDSAGGVIDDMGFSWDRGLGQPAANFTAREEVLFPCGGATLLRRSALEEPSTIFWDRLFMYLEDVDLGIRLWSRGWRVLFEPSAVTLHEHSATGSRYPVMKETACVRNRLLVLRRHLPSRKLSRLMPLLVLWQVFWACSALLRLRLVVFRAVVAGTFQGLLGGPVDKYPRPMADKLIQRFSTSRAKSFPKLQMARKARSMLAD
jgi:hypothetical protein